MKLQAGQNVVVHLQNDCRVIGTIKAILQTTAGTRFRIISGDLLLNGIREQQIEKVLPKVPR